jgi:hypothetical protein
MGTKKANSMKNVQRILDALDAHPLDKTDAGRALAFKLELPGLGSIDEIRLNIEAVAQGIALGIFTGREGSQLLYAAQVALSALARERSKLDRTGPKKKRSMQPVKKS